MDRRISAMSMHGSYHWQAITAGNLYFAPPDGFAFCNS